MSKKFVNPPIQKISKRLDSFLELENDWNGYGATPFDADFIERAKDFFVDLDFWAHKLDVEAFPIDSNAVQFECSGSSESSYVEVMFLSDGSGSLYYVGGYGVAGIDFENITIRDSINLINGFIRKYVMDIRKKYD